MLVVDWKGVISCSLFVRLFDIQKNVKRAFHPKIGLLGEYILLILFPGWGGCIYPTHLKSEIIGSKNWHYLKKTMWLSTFSVQCVKFIIWVVLKNRPDEEMVSIPLPAWYYICKFNSMIILSPYHEVGEYFNIVTEQGPSLQDQYRIIKLLLNFFVYFIHIHLGLLNTENIMAVILFAIHVFCSKKSS